MHVIMSESVNISLQDNVKLNYRGPHEMSSVLAEFSNSKDVSVLDVGSGTGLLGEAVS